VRATYAAQDQGQGALFQTRLWGDHRHLSEAIGSKPAKQPDTAKTANTATTRSAARGAKTEDTKPSHLCIEARSSGDIPELNVIVAVVAASDGLKRLGRRRLTRFRMSPEG